MEYNILETIKDDAAPNAISWCTLSFLTATKIDKINFLHIKGFRIYNGYTSESDAEKDANLLRAQLTLHDIFVAPIGKVLAWDDLNCTEKIDYKASTDEYTDKLNDMESKRRESSDKHGLIQQQCINDRQSAAQSRAEKIKNNLQNKLHQKNKLTSVDQMRLEKQLDKFKFDPTYSTKYNAIKDDIVKTWEIDYLDESAKVPITCGIVTIYSPYKIMGINRYYLKINGLFDSDYRLDKFVKKYNKMNNVKPDIYRFDIGEWSAYSDIDVQYDATELLMQLNYCMKCYLDQIDAQNAEFNERMEKIKQLKEEQEAKSKVKGYTKTNVPENADVPMKKNKKLRKLNNSEIDNSSIQKLENFLNMDLSIDEINKLESQL